MKIPRTPRAYLKVFRELSPTRALHVMSHAKDPCPGGKYYHWDKLQHFEPPADLTHREWWVATKFARAQLMKQLPLKDSKGHPFTFAMPDPVFEFIHKIDRDATGRFEINEEIGDPELRDSYLINSLIDEAITSSQLEGAATTHRVAKDMIRSGRRPRDKSERMIFNNFQAMRVLRGIKGKPLTPKMVLDLHRIVTESTLENPEAAGRLRHVSDPPVAVWDQRDGTLLHTPPDPSELPERLEAMCRFANGRTPPYFVHPVLRAILLHLWVGFDHPFVDGNGRVARTLFYWSMLTQGYWLCEFISISSILKAAPAKYMRAYLYSETDDNDSTYFILYHLGVIRRAIEALHRYLKRKMIELRQTKALLRKSADLNHRQIALLGHALRHRSAEYTIQSHRTSHNVVYQTARTDLLELEDRNLLVRRRRGKRFYFSPPEDLEKRVASGRTKATGRRS